MGRGAVIGDRAADAELGALAEALADGVVGEHLRVRAAVLDQGGQFHQREDVLAGHRALARAGLAADHGQALGVGWQPQEALGAAESAAPQAGAAEPAERRGDAGREHAQHDLAQVVVHGAEA